MSFEAVVLAGGRARRMGGVDKPAQRVGGTSMLDRVTAAARAAGAIHLIGPEVDGGPVAAVADGVARVNAPVTVVLAADLPFIAPAIDRLLAALDDHEVALLDTGGRPQHLAAAWRTNALRAALAELGDPRDQAMVRLLTGRDLVLVPDRGDWGHDCDTFDDLRRAESRSRKEQT